MKISKTILAVLLLVLAAVVAASAGVVAAQNGGVPNYLPLALKAHGPGAQLGQYVVIGWNDLGMHCYDRDYSQMAVLPPYNNLWAQVIRRGDPPELVTQGVRLLYAFPDNTYSAGKTNFWDYAQEIFGLAQPLPPNVGLEGKSLAGELDPVASGEYFEAKGVPVTEFSDSDPSVPDPYQMARLTLEDRSTGQVLAVSDIVVPVSSEMRCDTCHTEPTGDFRLNILLKHDEEEGTNLASNGKSDLCADCHADPALGAVGHPGVDSLSAAMHKKHADEASEGELDPENCYACHPGPQTQCLRDVMSQDTENPQWCTDCHGSLASLGNDNRTPWADEPRCADCHAPQYAENPGKLFRQSVGHGGLYCEACHNSTHAILPSREARDNLQSQNLQGYADTIQECTVCHLTQPTGPGPHE
jgi:hypothetical protein